MTISDYFDENNKDHIKAYIYLSKNGVWPENFITNDIKFNATWHFDITLKLALKYIETQFDDICNCETPIPNKATLICKNCDKIVVINN